MLLGAWLLAAAGDVLGSQDRSSSAMAEHVEGQVDVAKSSDVGPRQLHLQGHSMPCRCSFTGSGDNNRWTKSRLLSSL